MELHIDLCILKLVEYVFVDCKVIQNIIIIMIQSDYAVVLNFLVYTAPMVLSNTTLHKIKFEINDLRNRVGIKIHPYKVKAH